MPSSNDRPGVRQHIHEPSRLWGWVFGIEKLLHGVSEDSDLTTLRVAEDGTYTVPWEIRAENLAEPARGELELQIATRVRTGPPITTLDELLRVIEPEGDEDEGAEDDE